jgi:hypothetical protein
LRNGYPRDRSTSRHDPVAARFEEDKDALQNISEFAAYQVIDCLGFFETLYDKCLSKLAVVNHQRALLIIFALEARLDAIVVEFFKFSTTSDDFCDGGYSALNFDNSKSRFQRVIAKMCGYFSKQQSTLTQAICSMDLLREASTRRLGYEVKQSTDAKRLQHDIIHQNK